MFGGFGSYFQILWRFLRRLRSFSSQKTQMGPVTGQNKISKIHQNPLKFLTKLEELLEMSWKMMGTSANY